MKKEQHIRKGREKSGFSSEMNRELWHEDVKGQKIGEGRTDKIMQDLEGHVN